MKLRPTGNRVIIKPIHKSAGYGEATLIHVPEEYHRWFTGCGKVLAIGPRVDGDVVFPCDVVAFNEHRAAYIETDGNVRVAIVDADDIAATWQGREDELPDHIDIRRVYSDLIGVEQSE